MRRALTLAEPEGYTRVFVDEGSALAHLLYRVAEQDGATNYTGRLLAAFDNVEKKEKQDFEKTGSPDIVEPLSTRELEVLHLIAEGLSNRAIAERLFITLSTVKGHTSAIYGKLDVRNRTQAVARAREWDLLHN
ncbi:MAG: hypothetical protein JXA33_06775 [Anaerolineae bacterium]|nr:hypothetical protein [Anaerolineae bacterium]